MYKELILFLFIILFSGCSVLKIQNSSSISEKSGINLEEIRRNNLTNKSFFIQKAEVELVSEEGRERFLASVKFNEPDSFLVSLRSKTGIEAARIFLTKDTLLINDRVNRKLYFGSANDLKKRYGYSSKLLPLLFGDFILSNVSSNEMVNCQKGVYNKNTNYDGLSFKYIINCNSAKLLKLELTGDLDKSPMVIEYSEKGKTDDIFFYSKVHITNFKGFKYLNINYRKIQRPYSDYIEFIPGKNYTIERIR